MNGATNNNIDEIFTWTTFAEDLLYYDKSWPNFCGQNKVNRLVSCKNMDKNAVEWSF